jgi:hypothetical protein
MALEYAQQITVNCLHSLRHRGWRIVDVIESAVKTVQHFQ